MTAGRSSLSIHGPFPRRVGAMVIICLLNCKGVQAFAPKIMRRQASSTSSSLFATDPTSIVHFVETVAPSGVSHMLRDMATGGSLAVAGDVLAQSLANNKRSTDGADNNKMTFPPQEWDQVRTAALGIFGALYTGGAQHFIFSFINESFTDPIQRLALAQFCFIPFLYYPTYLLLVPAMRSLPLSGEQAVQERDRLRSQVIERLPATLVRNWSFWIPVQFIQFSYVPPDMHVTYCAAFGVIWNAILSWSTMQEAAPKIPAQIQSTTATTSSSNNGLTPLGRRTQEATATAGSKN